MRSIRPPNPWLVVLAGIIGTGLSMVLLIGYVNQVDRDAERRNVERGRDWCRIIVMLDDRNQTLPPATDQLTAEFRTALHDLRISKGC